MKEFNVNRFAVIQDCAAEHVEDESQMSPSQVDEKTGKVVCRQHTDGNLTKEMK